MKKTKIFYWITTILFALFMAFTALPDITLNKDAVVFMTHLGYPNYFTVFIGVAKMLGCIALLIPGFPRIKEWAYAGLMFDLIGAVYSIIAVEGFNASMLFMLLPFVLFAFSYGFHHQLLSRRKTSSHQYAAA